MFILTNYLILLCCIFPSLSLCCLLFFFCASMGGKIYDVIARSSGASCLSFSWHSQKRSNILWKRPKNCGHVQGGGAVNCNIHRTYLSESLSSASSRFTPDSPISLSLHLILFSPFFPLFFFSSLSVLCLESFSQHVSFNFLSFFALLSSFALTSHSLPSGCG